jgi:hypothetical protein
MAILALGQARGLREPKLGCRGLTDLSDVMLFQKSLHKSCRMGRCNVVMKLICSLGHCECDSHTVHKLSQRRLTADWLVPQESDCSQVHSKVSDWLTDCRVTSRPHWLVLEIFEVDGYFPDSLHNTCLTVLVLCSLSVITWHVSWLCLNAMMWFAQKLQSCCPSVLHEKCEEMYRGWPTV